MYKFSQLHADIYSHDIRDAEALTKAQAARLLQWMSHEAFVRDRRMSSAAARRLHRRNVLDSAMPLTIVHVRRNFVALATLRSVTLPDGRGVVAKRNRKHGGAAASLEYAEFEIEVMMAACAAEARERPPGAAAAAAAPRPEPAGTNDSGDARVGARRSDSPSPGRGRCAVVRASPVECLDRFVDAPARGRAGYVRARQGCTRVTIAVEGVTALAELMAVLATCNSDTVRLGDLLTHQSSFGSTRNCIASGPHHLWVLLAARVGPRSRASLLRVPLCCLFTPELLGRSAVPAALVDASGTGTGDGGGSRLQVSLVTLLAARGAEDPAHARRSPLPHWVTYLPWNLTLEEVLGAVCERRDLEGVLRRRTFGVAEMDTRRPGGDRGTRTDRYTIQDMMQVVSNCEVARAAMVGGVQTRARRRAATDVHWGHVMWMLHCLARVSPRVRGCASAAEAGEAARELVAAALRSAHVAAAPPWSRRLYMAERDGDGAAFGDRHERAHGGAPDGGSAIWDEDVRCEVPRRPSAPPPPPPPPPQEERPHEGEHTGERAPRRQQRQQQQEQRQEQRQQEQRRQQQQQQEQQRQEQRRPQQQEQRRQQQQQRRQRQRQQQRQQRQQQQQQQQQQQPGSRAAGDGGDSGGGAIRAMQWCSERRLSLHVRHAVLEGHVQPYVWFDLSAQKAHEAFCRGCFSRPPAVETASRGARVVARMLASRDGGLRAWWLRVAPLPTAEESAALAHVYRTAIAGDRSESAAWCLSSSGGVAWDGVDNPTLGARPSQPSLSWPTPAARDLAREYAVTPLSVMERAQGMSGLVNSPPPAPQTSGAHVARDPASSMSARTRVATCVGCCEECLVAPGLQRASEALADLARNGCCRQVGASAETAEGHAPPPPRLREAWEERLREECARLVAGVDRMQPPGERPVAAWTCGSEQAVCAECAPMMLRSIAAWASTPGSHLRAPPCVVHLGAGSERCATAAAAAAAASEARSRHARDRASAAFMVRQCEAACEAASALSEALCETRARSAAGGGGGGASRPGASLKKEAAALRSALRAATREVAMASLRGAAVQCARPDLRDMTEVQCARCGVTHTFLPPGRPLPLLIVCGADEGRGVQGCGAILCTGCGKETSPRPRQEVLDALMRPEPSSPGGVPRRFECVPPCGTPSTCRALAFCSQLRAPEYLAVAAARTRRREDDGRARRYGSRADGDHSGLAPRQMSHSAFFSANPVPSPLRVQVHGVCALHDQARWFARASVTSGGKRRLRALAARERAEAAMRRRGAGGGSVATAAGQAGGDAEAAVGEGEDAVAQPKTTRKRRAKAGKAPLSLDRQQVEHRRYKRHRAIHRLVSWCMHQRPKHGAAAPAVANGPASRGRELSASAAKTGVATGKIETPRAAEEESARVPPVMLLPWAQEAQALSRTFNQAHVESALAQVAGAVEDSESPALLGPSPPGAAAAAATLTTGGQANPGSAARVTLKNVLFAFSRGVEFAKGSIGGAMPGGSGGAATEGRVAAPLSATEIEDRVAHAAAVAAASASAIASGLRPQASREGDDACGSTTGLSSGERAWLRSIESEHSRCIGRAHLEPTSALDVLCAAARHALAFSSCKESSTAEEAINSGTAIAAMDEAGARSLFLYDVVDETLMFTVGSDAVRPSVLYVASGAAAAPSAPSAPPLRLPQWLQSARGDLARPPEDARLMPSSESRCSLTLEEEADFAQWYARAAGAAAAAYAPTELERLLLPGRKPCPLSRVAAAAAAGGGGAASGLPRHDPLQLLTAEELVALTEVALHASPQRGGDGEEAGRASKPTAAAYDVVAAVTRVAEAQLRALCAMPPALVLRLRGLVADAVAAGVAQRCFMCGKGGLGDGHCTHRTCCVGSMTPRDVAEEATMCAVCQRALPRDFTRVAHVHGPLVAPHLQYGRDRHTHNPPIAVALFGHCPLYLGAVVEGFKRARREMSATAAASSTTSQYVEALESADEEDLDALLEEAEIVVALAANARDGQDVGADAGGGAGGGGGGRGGRGGAGAAGGGGGAAAPQPDEAFLGNVMQRCKTAMLLRGLCRSMGLVTFLNVASMCDATVRSAVGELLWHVVDPPLWPLVVTLSRGARRRGACSVLPRFSSAAARGAAERGGIAWTPLLLPRGCYESMHHAALVADGRSAAPVRRFCSVPVFPVSDIHVPMPPAVSPGSEWLAAGAVNSALRSAMLLSDTQGDAENFAQPFVYEPSWQDAGTPGGRRVSPRLSVARQRARAAQAAQQRDAPLATSPRTRMQTRSAARVHAV